MSLPSFTVNLDVPANASTGLATSLRCHPGRVRTENQDRVGRAVGTLGEVTVVADGVGGGAGGAQAAALAIEEYTALAAKDAADPQTALHAATLRINQRIQELQQADPALHLMASTVAVVVVQGTKALTAHLGDSRVYMARGQEFNLLTRDHSVVRRMVDAGVLDESEALTHPKAHILSASLGRDGCELEFHSFSLQLNDLLLVCSDGLWAYVDQGALHTVMSEPGISASSAADTLLQLALEAGAPDNVGLAVIHVHSLPSAPIVEQEQSPRSVSGRKKMWLIIAICIVLLGLGIGLWFLLNEQT